MSNLGRNVLARIIGNPIRYKRVLAWSPPGPRSSGPPPNSWAHKLTSYCQCKNFGHWVDAAEDQQSWGTHLDDFIDFCQRWAKFFLHITIFFTPVPTWARHCFGVQARLDSTC